MDYQRYLQVLARRWRLLAAGTAIAALAALLVTLVMPRTYEATATVVVTRPQYQFQFDPRLTSAVINPQSPLTVPSKAHIALAKTDAVERAVAQELGPGLENGERAPGGLLSSIKVEQAGGSRGDPNVFEIKAQASEPEKAQRIANTWANTYVKLAQELYSQSSEKQEFIQREFQTTSDQLRATEDAMVEFQRTNAIPALQQRIDTMKKTLGGYILAGAPALPDVISGQLSAQVKLYNEHLGVRNNLRLVRQDAMSLRSQLLSDPTGGAANAGVPALLLQIRSLNSSGTVQLQVSDLRPGTGRDNQLRQVEGLIQALDEQEALLAQTIDELARRVVGKADLDLTALPNELDPVQGLVAETTKDLQALQAQLQTQQNELDRLTRDRDVKKTTYTTLANKAEEIRVESSSQAKEVQLASAAARPERPVGRGVLPTVALAAVLGLLVTAGVALAMEYLPGLSRTPAEAEEPLSVPVLG